MNPPVLRQSPIHGVGLFAASSIEAGSRIIEYKGRRLSKAAFSPDLGRGSPDGLPPTGGGPVYLFELDSSTILDGNIPGNPARFINHSCDENCEAILLDGRIWIYARRDIAAGEELTFDYAYALEHFLAHPCHCGMPGCTGFIVSRDERPRLRNWLSRSRRTTHATMLAEPLP